MEDKKAEKMALGLSVFIGFMVCAMISKFTGRNEAWDSELYFVIGIPVMIIAVSVIAYKFSDRPMRFAFAMALGQSVAMALAGSSLSLWPLAIVGMVICSIPQFAAAKIASRYKKKKMNS